MKSDCCSEVDIMNHLFEWAEHLKHEEGLNEKQIRKTLNSEMNDVIRHLFTKAKSTKSRNYYVCDCRYWGLIPPKKCPYCHTEIIKLRKET